MDAVTPRKLEVIDGGLDEWIAKYSLDDALHGYTDTDYGYINRALVKGGKLEQVAPDLAKLFNHKGNYKGTVFRGTRLPEGVVKELKPNTLVQNDMVLSTTRSRGTYKEMIDYALYTASVMNSSDTEVYRDVVLEIYTHEPQYSIETFSKYKGEAEVIIAPKSTLSIVKIANNENHTIIRMRVLPADLESSSLPLVKGLMGMGGLIMINEGEDNGDI